jgi:preprotein translocase subunit SecE
MALDKKIGQEAKEQVTKDAKQSKSSPSAPKRIKPKGIEGTKKKAEGKSELLHAPRDWSNRLRQYLREVAHELRRVSWPSRKETIGSTAVVLVLVLLASLFLGAVDLALSKLLRLVIG